MVKKVVFFFCGYMGRRVNPIAEMGGYFGTDINNQTAGGWGGLCSCSCVEKTP